jgi:HAE1 family hydrophobic/amphiphilic exporter-1
MSLTKFATDHAVLANLLFVLVIVAGVAVYHQLPVDIYPDVSLDEASIQTTYLGASPEDVEQHVTRRIEEEVDDVPGVDRITSYSGPSISTIAVKFHEDLGSGEFEAAYQEVRARLDRVTDLPEEAGEPILTRLTLGEVWPMVQVVVANEGQASERQIRAVARDLKDELRAIDGVLRIKEVGLRDPEIHVLVDKNKLEALGLSLLEVADVLRRSNLNIPAGHIDGPAEEFTVRAVGDVRTAEQLGEICIKKSPVGAHIYLRDVAEVREDFERRVVMGGYMGRPCCFLHIAKKRDADSITVRDAVARALDQYRAKLPPGVSVALFSDTTKMISTRLSVLRNNILAGVVMVLVPMWVFMGMRNAMLALIGIPFEFLCTFIFMYAIGVGLNSVSVFALVLVSGILVDDAIVVLENIYRHVQQGSPLKQAVIAGTDEVLWPVTSCVLTTVAAFLPLLLMTGVIGRFFSIIPKTVTVALLAGLFQCFLILPVHYLHWGPGSRRAKPVAAPPAYDSAGYRLLRWLLNQGIRHRYLCLAIVVALSVCAYQAQRTLLVELFPSDFPTMIATFNTQAEASLEQTDAACARLLPALEPYVRAGYIKNHSNAIGLQIDEDSQLRQRSNIAQLWIELQQASALKYDPESVMADIRRDMLEFIADHPQLSIENFKVWPMLDGPPVGKPVALRIEHPDYARASAIARDIEQRLRHMEGVYDVADNFDIGQRELRLSLHEEAASDFGLTFQDVFSTVSAANEGTVVGSAHDSECDEDIDIRVRYQQDFRRSEDQLLDVDVKTAAGALVKLRQVASLEYSQGYATHYRFNGKRAIVVTASVDKKRTDAGRVARSILAEFGPLAARDEQLAIVAAGQF